MAATKNERELKRDEVTKRLEALCEKDSLWPAVLAARAALRIFPLTGSEGHFNFWIESERIRPATKQQATKQKEGAEKNKVVSSGSLSVQDNRARFILASFFASHLVLQKARIPIEQRQVEKLFAASAAANEAFSAFAADTDTVAYSSALAFLAADAESASSYGAQASRAGAFAALAADCAVLAFDADTSAAESADLAVANAFATFDFDAYEASDPYAAFHPLDEVDAYLQDVKAAESARSTNRLLNRPLWPDGCPEYVKAIKDKKFRPAVENLLSEIKSSNPESAKALAKMLTLYEEYLNGSKTADEDNKSPEVLYEAVSKLTADDNSANNDTLNRGALVSGLAGILCNDKHTHPLTIGLMGHWGSGKTQVLELLKKELNSRKCEQPFLFGEFNAWAYEHAKSSQAALAHEVISALTSCDRLKPVDSESNFIVRLLRSLSNLSLKLSWIIGGRARLIYGFAIHKHLRKVLQSFGWLVVFAIALSWLSARGLSQNELPDFSKPLTIGALIAALASLWQLPRKLRDIIAQPMTKEFLTYIKLPNYASHIGEIAEMQRDIRLMANLRLGFLEEPCYDHIGKIFKSRRLLFVVDDLDRCSPKGIVKTFEAIRLVLHIPHVTVVVAVDHRVALAALALHYKDIEPYHTLQDARAIARDYLAKIIQLPVVVSDGDDESLTEFLSDIWPEDGDKKNNWLVHLGESNEQNSQASSIDNDESDNAEATPEKMERNVVSEINSKELTEAELAKLILEDEPKQVSQKTEVLPGLNDHQKAALYYWATHFGLSNARQLKRLDNSYNLIRLVTDDEDKVAIAQEVGELNKQHVKFSYGYLVTLMSLEFINGIEVTELRENASRFLRKGDEDKLECMASLQHKATLKAARIIIEHAAERLYPQTDSQLAFDKLLRYVENFVLPAIDGFDIDTETVSGPKPKSEK
ncbi:hypothetical protein BM523_08165 [Alteromonas mediterranea]|uniref:KAP family P-loop NTPase fold protein n=1 Tax=Alteromonas mediterranea TaxID=314275 RepID=UPI0009040276|nr:P-loop NTPase fold protein [Alteromonas mediterranea]APD93963.1 hypothetical protein BM523_08165 [Alteromonas mediterranea]APD97590.1 hypothetical protein BM525_08200 [Alteromonas mediterranea]